MSNRLKHMDKTIKIKGITDKLHSSGVMLDKVLDTLKKGSKAKRSAGLKSGGRAAFKHGDYVRAPVPHADIDKLVYRGTGKEDDRKGNRVREPGSTLTMGGKGRRRAGRAGPRALDKMIKAQSLQQPTKIAKRAKMIEVFREGPRNEKLGIRVKRSLGGAATHGFNTKILRTE